MSLNIIKYCFKIKDLNLLLPEVLIHRSLPLSPILQSKFIEL